MPKGLLEGDSADQSWDHLNCQRVIIMDYNSLKKTKSVTPYRYKRKYGEKEKLFLINNNNNTK